MRSKKPYRLVTRLLLGIIFVLVLNFCGCSVMTAIDEGLKENKQASDDKYWTERKVPPVDLTLDVSCVGEKSNFDVDIRVSRCVYKYLEDNDKAMLKGMFAASVSDNYAELDNDIDSLMEFYQCLEVDGFEVDSNSRYKVHSLDPAKTIVEFTYHTNFTYNDETYVLDILFVTDSDPDKDLLGLHGLKLRNRTTNESITVNTIASDI